MIELVVVYCLAASPGHCVERREALTAYPSVAACTEQAEFVVQRYLNDHPKWRLDRWRCEVDKPQEDPA